MDINSVPTKIEESSVTKYTVNITSSTSEQTLPVVEEIDYDSAELSMISSTGDFSYFTDYQNVSTAYF